MNLSRGDGVSWNSVRVTCLALMLSSKMDLFNTHAVIAAVNISPSCDLNPSHQLEDIFFGRFL